MNTDTNSRATLALGGVIAAAVFAPAMVIVLLLGALTTVLGVQTTECGPGSSVFGGATTSVRVSDLSPAQMNAAADIVAAGQQLQVPGQGIVVALAVAAQESRFQNYANDGTSPDLRPEQRDVYKSLGLPHDAVGRDHGSLGVFQQQYPWWGTIRALMTIAIAAQKFFERLLRVPGWAQMSVTAAGQAVQKSAFSEAYADEEPLARALYTKLAAPEAVTGAPVVLAAANATAPGPGCDPGATTPTPGVAGTGWALPLDPGTYQITSGYGPRVSPTGGSGNFHRGLDFGAPTGTPIRAATDGVVTSAGFNNGGFGNLVVITTAPNIQTYYAHQSALTVAAGAQVRAGQVIGAVGTTGDSTGPHLHFEVRLDNTPTDPDAFLRGKGLNPSGPPGT